MITTKYVFYVTTFKEHRTMVILSIIMFNPHYVNIIYLRKIKLLFMK